MTSEWQYQLRFDVSDTATAEAVPCKDPALARLFDILAVHRAVARCQFDAFADYVAAAEVEGIESHPLYGPRRRSTIRRRRKST